MPIEFPGRRVASEPQVADRPVDPWSSAGSRLGSPRSGPAPAVVNPVPAKPEPEVPARKGPPGFVLGCLGLLIIAAVAVAFVWTVAEASVSDYVSDEIGEGISDELESIETVRIRGVGQIVVTADQINAELDRQRDRFAPLSGVRVEINPDGFVAIGSVAGIESRLTGTLDIAGGRVVVVEPAVSGPARRLIDADELARIFERELAALLQRLDLQPTSISLSDGTLVLQTAASS